MNERGSMVPYLGALLFVGFILLGLALDTALLAATYREVAFAADIGAEAGAAQVEVDATYVGETRLDRTAAIATSVAAALSARPRAGRTANATVEGAIVCVTVTDRFEPRILGAIGIGREGVTVRACAQPGRG